MIMTREDELFSQFVSNDQLSQGTRQAQSSSSHEDADEDFLLALRLSQEEEQRERNRGDAVPDEDMDSLLLAIRLSEEDSHGAERVTQAEGPQVPAQRGHQHHRTAYTAGDYARYSFANFCRTQSQPITALVNDPLAAAIREEFLERRSREAPHGSRSNSSTPTFASAIAVAAAAAQAPEATQRDQRIDNHRLAAAQVPETTQADQRRQRRRQNDLEQRHRRLQLRADFVLASQISQQDAAEAQRLRHEQDLQQEGIVRRLQPPLQNPVQVRQNPFQVRRPTAEQARHQTRLEQEQHRHEQTRWASQQRARWASQQQARRARQQTSPASTGAPASASSIAAADGEDLGDCPICLEPLNHAETGANAPRLLGCGHGFHRFCIDRWLESRPSCPLCRTQNP